MRWLAAVLALILAVPLHAQDSLPPAPWAYRQLDDPALEAKAHELMLTLRCLKCQSQSIADSDAPMAGDMRSQVRQRIAAGEDPEAIRVRTWWRMSPAIGASLSAIDWLWHLRQRSVSISTCALASSAGSSSCR